MKYNKRVSELKDIERLLKLYNKELDKRIKKAIKTAKEDCANNGL